MPNINFDLFSIFTFFYFATLHADQLKFDLGGYTIRINNLFALLLSILLLMRFRTALLSIHKKLLYPVIGFGLSILFSWMFSSYKERCFFYFGWYALTVTCYLLLPYFLVKLWNMEKVFKLYFLSFLLVGIYAATQLLLSFFHIQDPFTTQFIKDFIVRPNAFCFEPSFYALYMTPFVFLYNYHYIVAPDQPFFIFRKKSLKQALLVNFFYVISTSTSILFAYVFFVILLVVFKTQGKKIIRFLFGICVSSSLLALVIPFILRNFFLKFFYVGFITHNSFLERFVGLLNGWHIFLEHPLVGVGLGGYPCYLMDAYLQEKDTFTFLPMHEQIIDRTNPVKLFEAMSVSTELLASLGILGLCAFIYLFISSAQIAKQALARVSHSFSGNSEKSGLSPSFTIALLIALIVTVCIWQFNQGLLRTYIWVHFALTFAYLEKNYDNALTYHRPAQL